MKTLFIAVTLLVTVWAQSSEYLPPVEEYSGAYTNAVETNFLENEPAHTLADDGYRYKSVKRFRVHRRRRDVSELSNSYLPPVAASAPGPVYSAPAPAYSAPAPVYSAPAASESYEVQASEPAAAHTFGDDGYRYRAVKRLRVHRRRRDVSELSNSYLPPVAASAPGPVYSAPAPAYSAPAPVYSAPAATESYEVQASEPAPAHSLSDDGYRYRAVKRFRVRRRRRDVSELSNSYLPPVAASAPGPVYSAPAPVYSAPAPVYSAPAASETYEVQASEPAAAHTFGDDGYRYRAVKRLRVHRRRRDVSELSNSYLPPVAASAPGPVYSAPAPAYSAPAPVYSAPAATESYEVEASEPAPAHSLSDDGYRYRAVKRFRVRRRRRDVSELSNSYLPPVAASAPGPVYSAPAPVYSASAASETYEVQASEPAAAHTFGDDGYRYRAVKRLRVHRRRRDVSELSNSYLPPVAASAPGPVYSAPAPAYSAPAPVYSAPAATESYEVQASEPAPAHSLSDDGYRYKTVKRYRLRRRY